MTADLNQPKRTDHPRAPDDGRLAYIRQLKAEEARGLFPSMPEVAPDLKLWALLDADGSPIMLADTREAVELNAMENDLETVSRH